MPRSRKTAVAVAGLVAATLAGTASNALAEPQGGSHSWFSPLPTIKSTYQPSLNVETRP